MSDLTMSMFATKSDYWQARAEAAEQENVRLQNEWDNCDEMLQNCRIELEDAREKAKGMHRRAQIAEGMFQSICETLEGWRKVCSHPTRDAKRLLFHYALLDMEKAKARAEGKMITLPEPPQ